MMLQTDVFCTAPQTEGMPSHLTTSSTHHPHPLHPHAPTPPLRQNNLTSVTFKSPPSSLVNVHSLKYTLHATQIRHTRNIIMQRYTYYVYIYVRANTSSLPMCFPDTHWMDFLLHQSITHQMQMSCIVIASKGIYNNISAAQKSLIDVRMCIHAGHCSYQTKLGQLPHTYIMLAHNITMSQHP